MIRDNILKVQERIALVCSKLKQDPRQITVIAVSKGRTAEEIIEAAEAGIAHVGENKVQEAAVKYNALKAYGYDLKQTRWHMVGHLQTNKAKEAVRVFHLIHSVDSMHLAEEIDKQAGRINKFQDILVQVNTSGENTKFGLPLREVIKAAEEMAGLKHINIKGLMTIAPALSHAEEARPCFRLLRELKDRIDASGIIGAQLGILSMGMSEDFEVAIEEGANMIRLGRAIFSRQ